MSDGVPLDALAGELVVSRNVIYKTMFDARSKLRATLVANGILAQEPGEALMNSWPALDRFLQTDPRDAGCDKAMELLHTYAEIATTDPRVAEQRYPEVAAHLRACGPCAEDLAGLLAAIKADLIRILRNLNARVIIAASAMRALTCH